MSGQRDNNDETRHARLRSNAVLSRSRAPDGLGETAAPATLAASPAVDRDCRAPRTSSILLAAWLLIGIAVVDVLAYAAAVASENLAPYTLLAFAGLAVVSALLAVGVALAQGRRDIRQRPERRTGER